MQTIKISDEETEENPKDRFLVRKSSVEKHLASKGMSCARLVFYR